VTEPASKLVLSVGISEIASDRGAARLVTAGAELGAGETSIGA
jgi:hypothetical protein